MSECWQTIRPQVSLLGELTMAAARDIIEALHDAEPVDGYVVFEVTTPGGDADLALRIAHDIQRIRATRSERLVFVGRTIVYSAGITIMSAFPREDRFLEKQCWLMIHGRQLDKTVDISGPMRASLKEIEAVRRQIENGLGAEEEGFRRLIEGSSIGFDEILERSQSNWYLHAHEAHDLGLIAGLVD